MRPPCARKTRSRGWAATSSVRVLWDVNRADDAAAVASKLIKSVSTPYAIEGESISADRQRGHRRLPGPRRRRRTSSRARRPRRCTLPNARGKNAFRHCATRVRPRPAARLNSEVMARGRLQLHPPAARALGRGGHAESGVQRPHYLTYIDTAVADYWREIGSPGYPDGYVDKYANDIFLRKADGGIPRDRRATTTSWRRTAGSRSSAAAA